MMLSAFTTGTSNSVLTLLQGGGQKVSMRLKIHECYKSLIAFRALILSPDLPAQIGSLSFSLLLIQVLFV